MNFDWDKLLQWGPGIVIALIILGGLYRLFDKFGSKLVGLLDRLGNKFIEAQQLAATNLGAQAQAMEGLRTSIESAVSRDDNEHKEILIMLKMIWQKINKDEGNEIGS